MLHIAREVGGRGQGQGLGGEGSRMERGARRASEKACPKEVLQLWAEQWFKEGVKVDWQKLSLPPKGFLMLCRSGGLWNAPFLGRTRTGG
jgi:hypothetical protein